MTNPRTALVTGGSRGIGGAIAERLAAEGYSLTIAARQEAALLDAAQRLRKVHGVEVHTVVADMTDEDQVRALGAAHAERFERLDVLVLAAGLGTAGPVATMSKKTLELMLNVNLRAPIALLQETLPQLRKSAALEPGRGAKVIALASMAGVAGEAGLAAYGATKAALISLCETLSLEESSAGVAATAISPGYVDTDMTAWKRSQLDQAAMLTTGDIAEMAMAITRLSSNAVVPNIVISRAGSELWRA
ncbi:SDR family NAD(P)-dependent oxidoreductase [Smaragdicoccus niigatensis]|uniref:SDR family NAD(P)-dependent oxidoreductase n=1 Tax=Smaragdicoccus niigatensis TaxID=359359 RepID=UPI00036E1747|nr:SDR family oxidoreductase [Smaragdicoccus niigatensis]